MSVRDAWQIVNEFQALVNPSGEQIVELDIAMMIILRSHSVEKEVKNAGYSVRYPRYQNSYPLRSPQEELSILQDHYNARCRDLSKLRRLIEKKQVAIERSCAHEWQYDETSRDHRSHYVCKICGSYR